MVKGCVSWKRAYPRAKAPDSLGAVDPRAEVRVYLRDKNNGKDKDKCKGKDNDKSNRRFLRFAAE
jgi:hypothetical protein